MPSSPFELATLTKFWWGALISFWTLTRCPSFPPCRKIEASPLPAIVFTTDNTRFLSPDGRCYSFDSRASGYARGEGVVALLLKPLSAALRDGDTVRSVIRGSAVVSDGKTPGITMPSPDSQFAAIRRAYKVAGLDPRETVYVEAHGKLKPTVDLLAFFKLTHFFLFKSKQVLAPMLETTAKPKLSTELFAQTVPRRSFSLAVSNQIWVIPSVCQGWLV